MRKKIVVVVCLMCLLAACGNQQQRIEKNQSDNIYQKDYEQYNGYWSENGVSHEKIIEQGGAELYISISENNLFEGSIYTQQGKTDRFAEIDNVSGRIQNDEMEFEFSDDGWGNSGILHIDFSDNEIRVEVTDFIMDEENAIGYGISGNYCFARMVDTGENRESIDIHSMTEEELIEAVNSISQHYKSSKYYEQVMEYWENERETRDISNVLEPLFNTDTIIYTKKDIENEPNFIIHLGKNEIYARHGYIFKDEDLNNYFMGCVWYNPLKNAEQFDTSVFNEVEQENLELFSEMDTFE